MSGDAVNVGSVPNRRLKTTPRTIATMPTPTTIQNGSSDRVL
jgi:hypothetical protein